VGIITGTYSTVFIAASIAIILSRKAPPTQAGVKAAEARRRRA
jgi:preprotein translocase subunit SecF